LAAPCSPRGAITPPTSPAYQARYALLMATMRR
jgi:hypothetical protein